MQSFISFRIRLFTQIGLGLFGVAALALGFGIVAPTALATTTESTTIAIETNGPVTPNESIVIRWDTPQSAGNDWVGLFPVAGGNTQYVDWGYVTGDTGTIALQAAQPGEYEARYLVNNSYQDTASSQRILVEAEADTTPDPGDDDEPASENYNLTVEPDGAIAPGATIQVRYEAPGSNLYSNNWIGLYTPGANNQSYLSWQYTDQDGSGTLSFTIRKTGTYEFRYFKGNGYDRVAVSNTFVVATGDEPDDDQEEEDNDDTGEDDSEAGDAAYSIEQSGGTVVEAGERITVLFAADTNANRRSDWVALYPVGASAQNYLAWNYTNAVTNGTLEFTAPNNPGTYEFRYLKNNGFIVVAVSEEFTVYDDTTSPPNDEPDTGDETDETFELTLIDNGPFTRNDTVTIRVEATANTIDNDWVGLYRTTATNRNYDAWTYVTGRQSELTFTLTKTGTYEFRYLRNNGYQDVARTESFTVVADDSSDDTTTPPTDYSVAPDKTSYDVDETINAVWSSPAGTSIAFDWIGLYQPGFSDLSYLDYEYVDRFSNEEQFAVRTPGTYELRYFTKNSYNRVATSDTFTVGSAANLSCSRYDLDTITNFPPGSGPIIALGDSLTFGVGASQNEDYVSELERRLNIPIINAGVPADTTADVLARLESDVLRRDPSVVIVFIGGNDELRRIYQSLSETAAEEDLEDELDTFVSERLGLPWEDVPLLSRTETYNNLETIIERIQATGAVTILVGFDNTIYNNNLANVYQDIADDSGSLYVPDIYEDIFLRRSRMSDLIHPNDAGYDIMADRIQTALSCAISE